MNEVVATKNPNSALKRAFLVWLVAFVLASYWLITPQGNDPLITFRAEGAWSCLTKRGFEVCTHPLAVKNLFQRLPKDAVKAWLVPIATPYFMVMDPYGWRRFWFGAGLLTNPYLVMSLAYLVTRTWEQRRTFRREKRTYQMPELPLPEATFPKFTEFV